MNLKQKGGAKLICEFSRGKFMLIFIFVYFYLVIFISSQCTDITINPSALSIPGSCIKMKINLNFHFHTSLWFIKLFEAPQRRVKIKI